jgi:serine/threonine-protein kinase
MQQTTTYIESTRTHYPVVNFQLPGCSDELKFAYQNMLDEQLHKWTEDVRFLRQLGSGGQGVVFLSERRGVDNFALPVAIKVFSPERYHNDEVYDEAMRQLAHIASKIAQIQHDNLLDVQHWRSRDRIRIMEMEWVEGFDLNQLLDSELLNKLENSLAPKRWHHLTDVVVAHGPVLSRIKPCIAISIIRNCLAGLGALHRHNIVHGDIKPANIMIKRTGSAKIVDMGSAFEVESPPPIRLFTLSYASPEALERRELTPRSDLASLGYVLIELLSGRRLFESHDDIIKNLEGRLNLPQQLTTILPPSITSSKALMRFIGGMIAPDPSQRFENAEAADLIKDGAAAFQRELVRVDLSCEPESELRNWMDDIFHISNEQTVSE